MKIKIVIVSLIFFLVGNIIAQETLYKIKDENEESIKELYATDHYVCINIEGNEYKNKIELYNYTGENIFSKNIENKIIHKAVTIEADDLLIIITEEGEPPHYNKPYVIARAYSIADPDRLVWETPYFSGPYDISPDGKKIINKFKDGFECSGSLTILNLANGEIKKIRFNDYNDSFNAVWLNNAEIAIVLERWEINHDYNNILEKRKLVSGEIKKIKRKLINNELTNEEANVLIKKKRKEKDSLLTLLDHKRGMRGQNKSNITEIETIKKHQKQASEIIIFDIEKNQLKSKHEISILNDDRILKDQSNPQKILSDKERNIYLFCNSNLNRFKNCVVSINENGKENWVLEYEKSSKILIEKQNNEKLNLYLIDDKDESYSISLGAGKLTPQNITIPKASPFNNTSNLLHINRYDKVQYNPVEKSVIINGEVK